MNTGTIFWDVVFPGIVFIGLMVYFMRPKKSKTEKVNGDIVYQNLVKKDAEAKMKEKNAVLVDIRSADRYAKSHLRGSVNLPYFDLRKSCRKVIPNKKSLLLVYGDMKERNNEDAAKILIQLGYPETYDIGSMNVFLPMLVEYDENGQEILETVSEQPKKKKWFGKKEA